nr:MAG TPA: hypothetical protein [Caudoviricetes sp.]
MVLMYFQQYAILQKDSIHKYLRINFHYHNYLHRHCRQ